LAFHFTEGDVARLDVVCVGARLAASVLFDTLVREEIRVSCVPTVTECAPIGPRRYATIQLFGRDARPVFPLGRQPCPGRPSF
jgi:hypothetical protein